MGKNGLHLKPPEASRTAALVPPKSATRRSSGSDVCAPDHRPQRLPRKPVPVGDPSAEVSDQWQIKPAGNRSPSYLVAKRIFDVAAAISILLLLSPLLLVVWAILVVTTKGHPFFVQERLGFLARPFRLYKFRTMVMNAEKLRALVRNEQDGPIFKNRTDPRITRVGRFLRRTSIDEVPQLFNVLRGDMSLIGPRPPLAHEVAQYKPLHRKRLAVVPGLTCLWQVSGRSEIGFNRWMQMDLWYIKHQHLLTDLAILLRTPWAVLSGQGAH